MKPINKIICVGVVVLLSMFSFKILSAQTLDTGSVNTLSPTASMGSKAEMRYDVEFRQASLRDALQFLSWIGDTNIIIPEGTSGVVTVSLKDISVRDAITSIVKANNLEYTIEGGIVRVGSKDMFRDSGEDLRTETFRLKYAIAKDMQPKVEKILSTRGALLEDERTNSLIVRELPANIESVRRLIEDVDIKDAQVLIDAKIMEATRSFARSLGIQWGVNMSGNKVNVVGVKDVGSSDSSNPLNVNLPAANPTSGLGLLIGKLAGGTNIDVALTAAEQRGDVYIISEPSIVTSNGKPAHIRSGSTLLIRTVGGVTIGAAGGTSSSTGNGGEGLREIKTGVELNVVPHISIADALKLDIEAITSQPDFTRAIDGIPIVLDNTAKTTVLVKDGETTVIGGLSKYQDALTKKGVPGLSRIPLFGNLFKSKERQKENSDLYVFIKTTIVRGDSLLPAQVKVREVEQRKEQMVLNPIIQQAPEVKQKSVTGAASTSTLKQRGHKYLRYK